MKTNIYNRILPLLLVVLLFPVLMAVPARADEVTDSGWINVLDFSTLNGSGSNIYYLYPGNISFYYDLPNIQSLSYVDLIFTGSYDMSHIQVNNGTETSNLTVVNIGGNLYRAFGYIGTQWTGRLNFTLPEVNKDYHITILQLEVTSVSLEPYDSHLVGDIQCGINHYNINSGQQSVYLTPYENDYDFKATLVPYEWYKFDFVKVYIDVDSYGIHSISVDHGGIPVPFEVSYLGPSSTENKYRFCVTIDTRHLDRVSTNNIDLRVFGRMDSDGAYFSILSVTGYVVVEEPSELRHWFTTLIDQFGGWFSEQFGILNNGFNGIISSVNTWGQAIVDAIAPDVDTSDMENSVSDAKQDLDDAQQAMDDFTLPSVDSVIPDVSGELEIADGSNFSYIMQTFFENPLILRMVTVGVGFMLFGIILG